jgi:hypothetical protein
LSAKAANALFKSALSRSDAGGQVDSLTKS